MNRRDFLKIGGISSLGAIGGGFPLLSVAARVVEPAHGPSEAVSKQLAMVIDIRKCLNDQVRRACTEACHREHNVPEIPDPEEEVKWLWSENYEHVFPDQAHPRNETMKGKPILVLCNQCTNPPCVKVCPTQATLKRKSDGIVTQDMHRCIGCRYCMTACPYGARSFNWRDPHPYIKGAMQKGYPARYKGVVEKCNFCAKRIRKNREPACVEASRQVPGGQGALTFGDQSDPDSDVSRLLREEHSICRRVSLGTGPNVYYIVGGRNHA
jgi:molybdopterin-containing oxidoreductase family iron-sulfur binding subunit